MQTDVIFTILIPVVIACAIITIIIAAFVAVVVVNINVYENCVPYKLELLAVLFFLWFNNSVGLMQSDQPCYRCCLPSLIEL